MWREVDAKGAPLGSAQRLELEKRRHKRAGRTVAWDLKLAMPAFEDHAYLEVVAHWRDEEECIPNDDGSQWGVRRFHVRKSNTSLFTPPF